MTIIPCLSPASNLTLENLAFYCWWSCCFFKERIILPSSGWDLSWEGWKCVQMFRNGSWVSWSFGQLVSFSPLFPLGYWLLCPLFLPLLVISLCVVLSFLALSQFAKKKKPTPPSNNNKSFENLRNMISYAKQIYINLFILHILFG